jgi:hypothetical protein
MHRPSCEFDFTASPNLGGGGGIYVQLDKLLLC